ncbi:MAG: hypothetical protein QM726_14470 [Chitinophagaceae bacterium]
MPRLFIFFSLLLLGCHRTKTVVWSRYKSGKVQDQFTFDVNAGRDTTGLLKSFFSNGKVEVIGRLQNGRKEGHWIQFTHAGDTVFSGVFKNGLLTGDVFEKLPNGWRKVHYLADKKEGRCIEFQHWEFKKDVHTYFYQVGQFHDDKPIGLWIRKDTNGIIMAENTYVDGIVRGYFTNRYANGNIKLKGVLNIDSAGTNRFDFYDESGHKKKLKGYEIDLVKP